MGLLKNSGWNLGGYVVPSLIAIPSMGYLARALGPELFGIYTLAIAIVGYAGIFDIGLTRAIVREIAVYRNEYVERKKIISTSTIFLLLFSTLGALFIYLFAHQIIGVLNISMANYSDVYKSLTILVWTIPIFLINQLWMSILEGDERFAILNIQRCFGSSIIAGLPALFVLFSSSLLSAIIGLAVGRLISLVISFIIVKKEISNIRLEFCIKTFKRMIFFGGWITVSNIISPLMVYFDRFVISGIMGAKNVGYYTAPSEIISRLSLIPGALSRAIFPRLSCNDTESNFKKNVFLSYMVMAVGCLPIFVIGFYFSNMIMKLWLGADYAKNSFYILQILLVGFYFNSIAQVPFTIIQALGKAKYTALLHCAEVLPYVALLYFAVQKYGLKGAAYAWSARVIIDCLLLVFISNKCMKRYKGI
ncbi:flippase [Pseudescherichia vulneris]|uniref:flippase n=1 Tax=Pseudescherichia vulneris TaxID=566 RepID=UPI0028B07B2B|nr:flippase [Pseudescherichia vulneris]